MELKSTSLGKHLAQHPYNRVRLLSAGVEARGDNHEYLIPFNQLIAINCKRGLVWGELEFVLAEEKVVRLHGTEWQETRRFYNHLAVQWQSWSEEMSQIAAKVLAEQASLIEQASGLETWLSLQALEQLQKAVSDALSALPLPTIRLSEFANCKDNWLICREFIEDGEQFRQCYNTRYTESVLQKNSDFFQQIESSPLNLAQAKAVINGEPSLLVLAGAGSGKTSVLIARAGWLLHSGMATDDQILLLAFGRQAADNMGTRIAERLPDSTISIKTFHALALMIIEQSTKKTPKISSLESDEQKRRALLVECWQQQCQSKKNMAKGWRQWFEQQLGWTVPEEQYWQDSRFIQRVATRLDTWLSLIRMHGGSQADMIAAASEEQREAFTRGIKLMAPLLKCWKSNLKQHGESDFNGLIHQAINCLTKGQFISPWKEILVDEFQDISPLRAGLLSALRRQNSQTALFAVGDDYQAIYRFSGSQVGLTTRFHQHFGVGETCQLDTTYRLNGRIADIASQFIDRNPHQLTKQLTSQRNGDKRAIALLDQDKLEALIDKLSGYVLPEQQILILGRYHYLRPAVLDKAATRWPKLNITFMTIHGSKGQEADYTIILGLNAGDDGFPARIKESALDRVLLPQNEDYADAEERRLLYVALTRARERSWLLYNRAHPSCFVEELASLGVAKISRP